MANTVISLRSSGVSLNTPSLGVLANGELSLNFADGILYYKTAANALGSIRTAQPSGLNQEIQFNDSGSFGANAALTFNKANTTLTTNNFVANTITTSAGGIIAGANVIYSNNFVANSTTTSISNTTGAIISNGGLGVKGNVYADAIYDGGVEVIVFAQAAFDKANTDVTSISATTGVYGNATHVPVITLTANGRISSVTNTAISSGGSSSYVASSNNAIITNNTSITSNATISANTGGLSVGPIIVANGNSVTVSANARWVVL